MNAHVHPLIASILNSHAVAIIVVARAMARTPDDELAQLDRIAADRERDAAFRRAHPELFEPIVRELTGEEAETAWRESAGVPLGDA